MIFLTVGSEIAFDRLVKAVDCWCAEHNSHEVFGQIADPGSGGYRPVNFEYTDFLTPQDYSQYYEKADLIVSHAGMGSIITALTSAKPILIMPRWAALEETRNDHQIATAERFSSRKGIWVARDEFMIASMLDQWHNRFGEVEDMESMGSYADERLIRVIRDFIHCSPKQ